ncbi:Acetyltransferase [Kalmusia sp. IMI 367209]|nr:Acetyltransferase [Kalmusia sp. IMI 367209]
MAATNFPAYPSFPSLRLATAEDVVRMADLSVLEFKESEIFRYERPHYDQYPHDAVISFANMYRSQLSNPRSLVIVAEDWRNPNEESHLPSRDSASERVVVGVASWYLPKGSLRTGQFAVPHVGDPEPLPNRDLCQRRWDIFTEVTEAEEKRYLAGTIICNKLVVHPSYRRRGHATFMLQWGLRLCDMDNVDQGVIPSHMGEPLYLSLGYKVIGEITIPDDGDVKGFDQRVILYKAKQKGEEI